MEKASRPKGKCQMSSRMASEVGGKTVEMWPWPWFSSPHHRSGVRSSWGPGVLVSGYPGGDCCIYQAFGVCKYLLSIRRHVGHNHSPSDGKTIGQTSSKSWPTAAESTANISAYKCIEMHFWPSGKGHGAWQCNCHCIIGSALGPKNIVLF